MLCVCTQGINARLYELSGHITDAKSQTPMPYVTVASLQNQIWTNSDEQGSFVLHVPAGKVELQVSYLGYVTQTLTLQVSSDIHGLRIAMEEKNLKIREVVITAQKRKESQTTSYLIDRMTLDHAQITNMANISSLLPGGKSLHNPNLASSDQRIALHSGSGEMGNASFGTAIHIDGMRLDNNASMSETSGVGLRNLSSSNIESVEIITGIPSVEYGDLSNGMVKIHTRKGKTPWNVEVTVEPKTKLMALSKGWNLGHRGGTLNVSLERAKSTSNLASPHTSYERNTFSLNYTNTLNRTTGHPLMLTANCSGNFGGFNSESDPDTFKDDYTKERDYNLRGKLGMKWALQLPWITNLSLDASVNYSDRLYKHNQNRNTASSLPYIHSMEEGYFVGTKYDEDPNSDIILSPVGYWYELQYNDQRPLTYAVLAKADWSRRWNDFTNTLKIGAQWNSTSNRGRGTYYDNMRYAPTWRPYRYDELPALNQYGLYAENKFNWDLPCGHAVRLTTGIRSDIASVSQSEYGTASSLSPRLNAKYIFIQNSDGLLKHMSVYGGIGKSVKLPSFEVLYPAPGYSDKIAFAPGTMNDGTTYYAYHTRPNKAKYNPKLKWQFTRQAEIGVEATLGIAKISLSAFFNKTYRPYMRTTNYTPYEYKQTSQVHLQNCPIPSVNRRYEIDRQTGIVTVVDRTGQYPDQVLSYRTRRTYYANSTFENASPIMRRGLDWIVDFQQIPGIHTSFRLDGNFYAYKGLDETLVADMPASSGNMANGEPYKYIGYYRGGSASSSNYSASASVSNGYLSRELNMNFTVTTHIPKVRMILSLRLESSLYNYSQELSEYRSGAPRAIELENPSDYFGKPLTEYGHDKYVAVYPEYYSSWEEPDKKIPFADKFLWAYGHDKALYNELAKLVAKTNTGYYFNPNKISAFFAANINLTKEIGNHTSVSFYAKNFFNHTGKVTFSQSGQVSPLYNSSLIPDFYYGITLRVKL